MQLSSFLQIREVKTTLATALIVDISVYLVNRFS